MGSEESHFNVSVGSDGQSHETVSTNRNLFEEKGAPKRYRTEGLPLTSLTARPNRLTMHPSTVLSCTTRTADKTALAGMVRLTPADDTN